VVYELKYNDRPDIGIVLGRMMANELQDSGFFEGIDMLVPVPLAPRRERQRGYNQSRQLALGISEISGLPVSDCAVRRTVFKGSQTELSRWDRQENVEDVFRLRDADVLNRRHVLLVDDIVTTGATVTACARELLKVDGVRLSILSFGYTKA
jgi:ComF family protein